MRTKKEKRQGTTVLKLLNYIEEFLELNNMDNDGNTFGWMVAKDCNLVQRLRDGGDVTTTRADDIMAFIQSPADFYRTPTSKGFVEHKPLKPLTIKL